MNIEMKNKKGTCSYIVTEVKYGNLRGKETSYVNGYYNEGIKRNNPTRLFMCKVTGRPIIKLSGKMYPINKNDDIEFDKVLRKAEIK